MLDLYFICFLSLCLFIYWFIYYFFKSYFFHEVWSIFPHTHHRYSNCDGSAKPKVIFIYDISVTKYRKKEIFLLWIASQNSIVKQVIELILQIDWWKYNPVYDCLFIHIIFTCNLSQTYMKGESLVNLWIWWKLTHVSLCI